MANNTIGQFISVLRKANGMTQQQLADRLNVSNKAVSRWERDETAPDITLIPAIAEIFGVMSPGYLIVALLFTFSVIILFKVTERIIEKYKNKHKTYCREDVNNV